MISRITTLESQGAAPPFVSPERQRFGPADTFGFVPRDASSPTPADSTPLPVIATVRSSAPYPYDVRLAGIDSVDGRPADDIVLVPRHDPAAFPLRELWIDRTTSDVLRMTVQKTERFGPIAVPYRLDVWYGVVGPYWLIERAASGATIHAGLFQYGASAQARFSDFDTGP